MAKIKIRYYTVRYNVRGEVRARYWQPKPDLVAKGWSVQRLPDNEAEAITEAERLNRGLDEWRKGNITDPITAKAGTVEALIDAYRNTHHYRVDLAEKTRQGYEQNFVIIKRLIGDWQVKNLRKKHVNNIYDKIREKTPAVAAAVIRCGRLLYNYAIDQELADTNPFSKPGITGKAKKGTVWPLAAVLKFTQAADASGNHSIGTAVFINYFLGQRQGDILSLTAGNYQDGYICHTSSKTGVIVYLPVDIIPEISARLKRQMEQNKNKNGAIVQKNDGTAYTGEGFRTMFTRARAEAFKDHPEWQSLIFKDLRHSAISALYEAGCTDAQVAAVSGHVIQGDKSILDRYNIRGKTLAAEAFKIRLNYEERKKHA